MIYFCAQTFPGLLSPVRSGCLLCYTISFAPGSPACTRAKIKKGDTVITSELSGIFPEGIMVGVVEDFERRQNESFYTAKIKLSADLKKVNHVYIIKNKFKTERDSLENKTQKQIDD